MKIKNNIFLTILLIVLNINKTEAAFELYLDDYQYQGIINITYHPSSGLFLGELSLLNCHSLSTNQPPQIGFALIFATSTVIVGVSETLIYDYTNKRFIIKSLDLDLFCDGGVLINNNPPVNNGDNIFNDGFENQTIIKNSFE